MESGVLYTVNGDIVYTIKDGKIKFQEDAELGKSKAVTIVDVVAQINQINNVTAVVNNIGLIEVRTGSIEVALVDIEMKYGLIIHEDFNDELPEETRGELLSLLIDISSRMPMEYEEQYEVYIESLDDGIESYLYKSEVSCKLFFATNVSTKFTEVELSMLPKYILEGLKSGLFKKRQVI